MMPMPGLLREHGIDAARLLAEFGFKPAYFEDPDNTIPLETMGKIYSRCASLTQCAHFGLLIGQRDTGSALGAVGFLMRNSPDVRTALGNLASHFKVHNRNAVVDFIEGDTTAALGYKILKPCVQGREQILDMAIAIGFRLMKDLCGGTWLPIEVRFAHTPQLDVTPFRRFFRVPICFEAEESALIFDRTWLDKPVYDADPLLHLMMARYVQAIESRLGDDLANDIRHLLRPLIEANCPSKVEMAKRIGLSARSLSRRLSAAGTSFEQLRDEARYGFASELLEGSRISATQVAERLGYSNVSAFSRAFLRWSLTRPTKWRASKRRSDLTRWRRNAPDQLAAEEPEE